MTDEMHEAELGELVDNGLTPEEEAVRDELAQRLHRLEDAVHRERTRSSGDIEWEPLEGQVVCERMPHSHALNMHAGMDRGCVNPRRVALEVVEPVRPSVEEQAVEVLRRWLPYPFELAENAANALAVEGLLAVDRPADQGSPQWKVEHADNGDLLVLSPDGSRMVVYRHVYPAGAVSRSASRPDCKSAANNCKFYSSPADTMTRNDLTVDQWRSLALDLFNNEEWTVHDRSGRAVRPDFVVDAFVDAGLAIGGRVTSRPDRAESIVDAASRFADFVYGPPTPPIADGGRVG